MIKFDFTTPEGDVKPQFKKTGGMILRYLNKEGIKSSPCSAGI
jgi:hypothetical protein